MSSGRPSFAIGFALPILLSLFAQGVGGLRLDSLLTYRVIQGSLEKLVIGLPPELNVTQVRGRFEPFAGVNLPTFLPETG